MLIMNGTEAAQKIRKLSKEILIFGLTASSPEEKEHFKKNGANEVYDKPLTPDIAKKMVHGINSD